MRVTCLEVFVSNLINLLLCAFNMFIYIMGEISVNADTTPTDV